MEVGRRAGCLRRALRGRALLRPRPDPGRARPPGSRTPTPTSASSGGAASSAPTSRSAPPTARARSTGCRSATSPYGRWPSGSTAGRRWTSRSSSRTGDAVARRDGEELRFRRSEGGWELDGDPAVLDHPDGLERAWAALRNPNAGDVLVVGRRGLRVRRPRRRQPCRRRQPWFAARRRLRGADARRRDRRRAGGYHRRRCPPCSRTSGSSHQLRSGRWSVQSDRAGERRLMVEEQLRRRGIVDERVLAAMARVPRELFVPEPVRDRAYDDAALPIGGDQTISQPYMVARICEALAVRPGDRVLDVGTGSGYQAAVLAQLGTEVHTIERLIVLAERARGALEQAGCTQCSRPRRRRLPRAARTRAVRGDRRGGRRSRGAAVALRPARARRTARRPCRRPRWPGAPAGRSQPRGTGDAAIDSVPLRAARRGRRLRRGMSRSVRVRSHRGALDRNGDCGHACPPRARPLGELDRARQVLRRRAERLPRQPRRLHRAAEGRRPSLPAGGVVLLRRRRDQQLLVEPALDIHGAAVGTSTSRGCASSSSRSQRWGSTSPCSGSWSSWVPMRFSPRRLPSSS